MYCGSNISKAVGSAVVVSAVTSVSGLIPLFSGSDVISGVPSGSADISANPSGSDVTSR
jgi:hypothetical protein